MICLIPSISLTQLYIYIYCIYVCALTLKVLDMAMLVEIAIAGIRSGVACGSEPTRTTGRKLWVARVCIVADRCSLETLHLSSLEICDW